MKKELKSLKKGDIFIFNDTTFVVAQKYSQWTKSDDPYLKTSDGQLWYNESLEVELKITTNEKDKTT